MEAKKLALLRVWQILKKESAPGHPLRQTDIIRRLKIDYGIELERKAVKRNLSLLKEAGIDVSITPDGSWIESGEFDEVELLLMIDFIRSLRAIAPAHAAPFADRVSGLIDRFSLRGADRRPFLNAADPGASSTFFYNAAVILSAENEGLMIQYDLGSMGPDKKLHKKKAYIVTPVRTFFKDGDYYLTGYSRVERKMVTHRVDRILNAEVIRKKGITPEKIPLPENGEGRPDGPRDRDALSGEAPKRAVLSVGIDLLDAVFDRFGPSAEWTKDGKDRVRVSIYVPPSEAKEWALGHLGEAEVLFPSSLRASVKAALETGLDRYR